MTLSPGENQQQQNDQSQNGEEVIPGVIDTSDRPQTMEVDDLCSDDDDVVLANLSKQDDLHSSDDDDDDDYDDDDDETLPIVAVDNDTLWRETPHERRQINDDFDVPDGHTIHGNNGVVSEEFDDEGFYEPLDTEREGIYLVKEYDKNTVKFRWRVDNVERYTRGRGVYSDVFMVAGLPWRLYCFPMGNNSNSLAVFLDVAQEHFKQMRPELQGELTKEKRDEFVRYAKFYISILNVRDVKRSHGQQSEKRFTINDLDWGFADFMPLPKVYSRSGDWYLRTSDRGHAIFLEVVVHVSFDIRYLFPHQYDSKTETGFIGMRNQGATCYLNSLLQSWFHITALRKAVYKVPVADDEVPSESIPLALQRVFWRLQYDNKPVDTKELTKSFGWDTMDSFMQHDVQELARVLSDKLEEKMAKTPVEGTMKRMFEGKIKNYIQCLNVDYESSRIEAFYDLQLNVKGCKNVLESFEKYVEDEILDGDNQYRAEGHGLQDAKKGCIFKKFPPVLTLHLKRFEYDMIRDMMYKVNDRYEFPVELDLNKFIDSTPEPKKPKESEGSEKNDSTESNGHNGDGISKDSADGKEEEHESPPNPEDNIYTLFSVLVHQGDTSGGHYYAFITTDTKQWFKFDDENVFRVRDVDVFSHSFGGQDSDKQTRFFWKAPSNASVYQKFTNAYMLIYIQKNRIHEILEPVSDEDVPKHLKERLAREEEENERRRKEAADAWKYVSVRVATDKHLAAHVNQTDLVSFSTIDPVKILKEAPISDLKKMIQEMHGIPVERQRLWRWESRQNRTYRPDSAISTDDEKLSFLQVFRLGKQAYSRIIDIYVEELPEEVVPKIDPTMRDTVQVFFKFYEPARKEIKYVGTRLFRSNDTSAELMAAARELMSLPEDKPLILYEEIKPTMIELIGPDMSLNDLQLQHGDIVTFQLQPPEEELKGYDPNATSLQCLLVKEMYNYLLHRVTVKFAPLEDPENVTHEIEMLKTWTYEQVQEVLAKHLKINVPASHIRFTGHHAFFKEPRNEPFLLKETKNLRSMLFVMQELLDTLYYEVLEMPLQEIESKKELVVSWYNSKVQEELKFRLVVENEMPVEQIIELIKERLSQDGIKPEGPIRLYGIEQFKFHRAFRPHEIAADLPMPRQGELRAEELTPEQLEMEAQYEAYKKDQSQVPELLQVIVVHFCRESSGVRLFDAPFIMVFKKSDTFSDVRDRIQEKLQIPDEEFKTYKFAMLTGMHRHEYLKGDEILSDELYKHGRSKIQTVLGMEHKDTNPKKPRASSYEKSIVIKT